VLQLWATNLEYDLINLFGADRIAECSLRFGRSYLIAASWRGVQFRDTVRHIPRSVKELGKAFGQPKLTRDRSIAYCLRDATITYRTARELSRVYGELGAETKTTLPSTAFSLWYKQHFGETMRRTSPEIYDAAGKAYYGGRTEAFAAGTFRDIHAIDAASMFPWAMLQGPFPVVWTLFRREAPGATPDPLGIYQARLESALPVPALPLRTDDGLIYPNGKWSSWYTGEELLYAHCLGVSVRVFGGFAFSSAIRPFDSYVHSLYPRKSSARGPLRECYKLLLNGLYGKFGQKGGRIVAVPMNRLDESRALPSGVRYWNGLAIYRTESAPPFWANNLWAGLVTSRARIKLHQEMLGLVKRGARLLYCDTDGILFSGSAKGYPEKAKAPGEFELRGAFKTLVIVGKKEYALEDREGNWQLFAKGVPIVARREYLRTGIARFDRPTRLLESGRIGVAGNVWRTIEKKRHVVLKKGGRNADGSLRPHVVGI